MTKLTVLGFNKPVEYVVNVKIFGETPKKKIGVRE